MEHTPEALTAAVEKLAGCTLDRLNVTEATVYANTYRSMAADLIVAAWRIEDAVGVFKI